MLPTAYTPTQQRLFVEANRVVIGLAGARLRGDREGLGALYDGFFQESQRLGISDMAAWSILAVAAVNWTATLVHREAAEEGLELGQVVGDLAGAVAEWAHEQSPA